MDLLMLARKRCPVGTSGKLRKLRVSPSTQKFAKHDDAGGGYEGVEWLQGGVCRRAIGALYGYGRIWSFWGL